MSRTGIEEQAPRLRLEYLDGLRGLAALYVVLFHAVGFVGASASGLTALALKPFLFGHFSVAVFIVLSGYCLMLPVARSADGQLRGGMLEYLKRRARRILPPYYAAILFSLLIIAAVPALQPEQGVGPMWDGTTPAFTAPALLSHLFLVQNLSLDWIHRINGPHWSVATEWQIYFFLPLLLLPLWQKAGIYVMTLVAFAIGLAPQWLAPALAEKAAPWYLGLFALGMSAAVIGFSSRPHEQALRERLPWRTLSLLAWLFCAGAGIAAGKWWWHPLWRADIFVGLATLSLLVDCTRTLSRSGMKEAPLPLRLFNSVPVERLGSFSYSLYLTHMPVLALCYVALRSATASPTLQLAGMFLLAVPVAVAVAFAFYGFFEKPFTTNKKPAARESERGLALTGAAP